MASNLHCLILILFISYTYDLTKSYKIHSVCDRNPQNVLRGKNTTDITRFMIDINGNSKMYTPGDTYVVTLKFNPRHEGLHMFRDFALTVEHEPVDNELEVTYTGETGAIILNSEDFVTFNPDCQNTIVQSSSVQKLAVSIKWEAPPTGSGCVAFKATVIESKEEWFSDDGLLTKILCEEVEESSDIQPPILKHCCACQEAKYEMAFQGMWSRNTHPKDFPENMWSTKFSDIVGSSHAYDKSFWRYGSIASDNLKVLAESGNTTSIEEELKQNMGLTVRTIIKANGLAHPNVKGTTYTVFRVDKKNHLVSIVSKLTPSPDWVVGVSSLELCQEECTWIESKEYNLYPWDIGIDDGVTYTSHEPTNLRVPIKRIKSTSPNDVKSPFYNEDGDEIKPLAKLSLTRLRVYEKECDGNEKTEDSSEEVITDPKCKPKEWSDWSPCSKRCGPGTKFRQRELEFPENEEICSTKLVEEGECSGKLENCGSETNKNEEDTKCILTRWSEWSSCSAPCGKGTKTRDKKFVDPENSVNCKNNDPSILQENEECIIKEKDCEEKTKEKENESKCPESTWGPWSACNVTCGTGSKTRYRIPVADQDEEETVDNDENCSTENVKEEVECYEPLCADEGEFMPTPFGELNALNQESANTIVSGPFGPVANCKVTKWSLWGPCEVSDEVCGKGLRMKARQIVQHAMNGGRACPRRLIRKKRCYVPCKSERTTRDPTLPDWGPVVTTTTNNGEVDCVLSEWSAWSPCSKNCGGSAIRVRTKSILVNPSRHGASCGVRVQRQRCPLPLACTDNGEPMF